MINQIEKPASFLKAKDVAAWAVYVAGTIGTLSVLQHLGVTDNIEKVWDSAQNYISEGYLIPENPDEAMMGAGFVLGCVMNVVAMGATLYELNGKVRLRGTGELEQAADGVMVSDRTCVDGRTPQEEQDHVEPGSGLMLGLQLRNTLISTFLSQIGSEKTAVDFLTGYFMGRALPTAAISTLIHIKEVATSFFKPAERVMERHHNHMCGWTATGDWISFWLKFTHKPEKILDTINIPSRILQIPMQAIEQAFLVPASLFRHITYPAGPSTIIDSH